MYLKRFFYTARLPALQRIGPHNINIISTLVGNLLGNSCGEFRVNSTRFHMHVKSRNVEYLHWLHKFYAERGYCSPEKPKVSKQIGKGGKIYHCYKWRTWSFSSLNWLYNEFYGICPINNKIIKQVPLSIEKLLTAQALAIWIMNDGSVSSAGVLISTEGFSFHDVSRLHLIIRKNFNLLTIIQHHGKNFRLYLPKSESLKLSYIVKPYMIPSMYYNLKNI